MAKEAAEKGIEMFALTDHGPALAGAPPWFYFVNLNLLPDEICGVRIIKGAEANIITYSGGLDLADEYLKSLEFTIASLHAVCIEPSTIEVNTNMIVNAIKNPCVDAIGHPGDPAFAIDIERVVKAAKEYGKLIEINNSFNFRPGAEDYYRKIISICKETQTKMICSSDAHISFDIGKVDKAAALLDELDVPQSLVINTSVESFMGYMRLRNERLGFSSLT